MVVSLGTPGLRCVGPAGRHHLTVEKLLSAPVILTWTLVFPCHSDFAWDLALWSGLWRVALAQLVGEGLVCGPSQRQEGPTAAHLRDADEQLGLLGSPV